MITGKINQDKLDKSLMAINKRYEKRMNGRIDRRVNLLLNSINRIIDEDERELVIERLKLYL